MNDELLYHELASWWPLMSAPEDYADEAALYVRTLSECTTAPPKTLLELGSGGGNNAYHMKDAFDSVTLVDRAPRMVDVSRALNPECTHVVGDMRFVRLGRTFDCVFVHDAICYALTLADLHRTVETAWLHCRPGGTALFVPDFVQETFTPSTGRGGHDGTDRALRYLEWTWDPDPADTTYLTDYAYLLRESDGSTSVRHDRHEEGLFARSQWVETMEAVGFDVEVLEHRHESVEHPSVMFVGCRPPER